MKQIPQISKYMTVVPHTVDYEQTIDKAETLMRENNIRHLPVTRAGKLVGLLSDKDVKSVLAFAGTDPAKVKVGDVCEDEVFTVEPAATIDEVAEIMAEKKFGSALVVDNNKLVGIFTVIDSLQALAEVTRQQCHR